MGERWYVSWLLEISALTSPLHNRARLAPWICPTSSLLTRCFCLRDPCPPACSLSPQSLSGGLLLSLRGVFLRVTCDAVPHLSLSRMNSIPCTPSGNIDLCLTWEEVFKTVDSQGQQ